MTTPVTRLAGLAGIVAPTFTLTLIFVSVGLSPWFSWQDNALSDMGVSATASLFNAALLIGGLLYLIFVAGFGRWYGPRSWSAKLACICLIAGGIGLTLVGVFNEDTGRLHYLVAAAYFLLTPLAYGLFGLDLLKRGKTLFGSLTLAAGVTAFVMIAFVPHQRIAVPEILASTILGAWTFAAGLQLLIGQEHSHE